MYLRTEDLPFVVVLISAYNEEKLIEKKLQSIFSQDYPKAKLQILVGSDCSSDSTDEIVQKLAQTHKQLTFLQGKERSGKPKMLNKLHAYCASNFNSDHPILILTDANVMFTKNTIYHLVKHFKDPSIHIVDANIINTEVSDQGIANSESTYIKREVELKYNEALIWQKIAGCFGGCFAMRMESFSEIPPNFIVDDFYLTMKVLEKGKAAISEPEAKCHEDLPVDIKEEFRRKKRISSGNFQNLSAFKHLTNPFKLTGFILWSHKFIRYIGPFLLIASCLSAVALFFMGFEFMFWVCLAQLIWFVVIPLLDLLLKSINLKVGFFRNVRYFNLMNVALLLGYKNYFNGIKNNTWEPTKRA